MSALIILVGFLGVAYLIGLACEWVESYDAD